MTRADWRHQPRRRPVLPPREAEDLAAWHAVVEQELARLFPVEPQP